MGSSTSTEGSPPESKVQEERHSPETLSFKVIVVGESAVGKTAVCERFLRNRFYSRHTPTTKVCIDQIVHKVNIPDDIIVSLSLWDVPSKEDLDLSDTYFKEADAAIVVVDITQKTSLQMAGYWRQHIISSLIQTNSFSTADAVEVPVLLIANKADKIELLEEADGMPVDEVFSDDDVSLPEDVTRNSKRELEILRRHTKYFNEIVHIAEENDFISGVLVSCKSPDGSVQQALQTLVRHLVECHSPVPQRTVVKAQIEVKETKEGETLTGAIKLRELAAASKRPIQTVKSLQNNLNKTELNFKLLCGEKKIIPLSKYKTFTLEFCVTALNSIIEGQHKLQSEDQPDGTVLLTLPEGDISHELVEKVLDELNNGFTAICGAILTQGKNLESELTEFDNQIMEEFTGVQKKERASIVNEKDKHSRTSDLKWMTKLVEQTRVDILAAVMCIDELNEKAARSQERIKSALLWS